MPAQQSAVFGFFDGAAAASILWGGLGLATLHERDRPFGGIIMFVGVAIGALCMLSRLY